MLPSIFDRGKLRTSRLCCSLSRLTVHTAMTGNTIERLMKLLYERLELMWLSFVHITANVHDSQNGEFYFRTVFYFRTNHKAAGSRTGSGAFRHVLLNWFLPENHCFLDVHFNFCTREGYLTGQNASFSALMSCVHKHCAVSRHVQRNSEVCWISINFSRALGALEFENLVG